jgi:probable HAF family extracellular repeat protein
LFQGWTGGCGGTGACDFVLDRDAEVGVSFLKVAPRYEVIDLGGLGESHGLAISPNGHFVAGSFQGIVDQHWQGGAFIWDGAFHDLGIPHVTTVVAVNDSGMVAGTWWAPSGLGHGFRYRPGVGTEDLIDLGGARSFALGMNREGIVVGGAETAYRLFRGDFVYHAVVWSFSGVTDLGSLGGDQSCSAATGINSAGVIVGETCTDRAVHAARFRGPGAIDDLGTLGGTWARAAAINDAGQMVGISSVDISGNTVHGFFFDGNRMIEIGTGLTALNSAGVAVGGGLYMGGRTFDLTALAGDGSYRIVEVGGIDDAGDIVVTGRRPPDSGTDRALLLRPH